MDLLLGKHPAIIKEELVHAYPEGQTSYRATREQALNNYASLSAMNSYFGFQTQKFPGFQNPDYLTLGDTF